MMEHYPGLYRAMPLLCSHVLLWRIWLFLRCLANVRGASGGTVGGVAVSFLCAQILLAQAWPPLPELSISPCPRDTDLCPWHSPVKGTAPGSHGLPCEIIRVMSTLGLGLAGSSAIFILHQMVQRGRKTQVISTKIGPGADLGMNRTRQVPG